MKRSLLVAVLYLAVSGGALVNHQAANLKPSRTVCATGIFEQQNRGERRGELLGGMGSALDDAGIKLAANCKMENAVGSKPQLNLYFTFATTLGRARSSARPWRAGWIKVAHTT